MINKIPDKCIIALCLLIMLSGYVTIRIPINGASQSHIGLCAFDVIYFFLIVITFEYLTRSRMVNCLKLVILNICIGGVIALIHFIFNQRSPVEFLGIIRNLFFYSFIYYVLHVYATKNQIEKALSYFFLLNTIMFFCVALVANISAEYIFVHSFFPDHWYVAVCGLLYLAFCSSINKRFMIYNQIGVISAALLVGSRAAFIISLAIVIFLFLYSVWDKSFEYKRKWLGYVVAGTGCVIVLCLYCLNSHLVVARCQRAGDVFSTVYIMVKDSKLAETETPEFINDSHVRSDLYRLIYRTLVMETAKRHPFLGEGKRIIEDVHGNKLYIHNFVYQVIYTFGIPYIICYFFMMLCFVRCIIFNEKCVRYKIGVLSAIGTLYVFALFQPSITGGPMANIIIWLLVGLGMDRDAAYTTER